MDDEETWIQTISGKKFPLDKPDVEQIDIEDIAHALSFLCRFNGQCKKFYSVAEHQCLLYDRVKDKDYLMAKWLLVHDAPEAFVNDIPTPLKNLLPKYQEIESVIEIQLETLLALTEKVPLVLVQLISV